VSPGAKLQRWAPITRDTEDFILLHGKQVLQCMQYLKITIKIATEDCEGIIGLQVKQQPKN